MSIVGENSFTQRVSNTQSIRSNSKSATKQKLITHSKFNGIWLEPLQCMDGYGVYTFPDGSEYRGYIHRGYFNGYGILHLAQPYGFTFKGTFIRGRLEEIEDMWFDDGLSVNATIDGWSMDFSSWKYCTNDDRRYVEEQREGLQPIGPFSRLTPDQPARKLNKYYFDVQEGIYNPECGLIGNRPEPFPKIKFVSCAREIDWIWRNCRHGPLVKIKVEPEVCHKIMHNNLNNELELAEHVPNCNYNQEANLKNYFGKLCPTLDSKGESTQKDDSENSVGNCLRNSSSTCSSFCTTSMNFDIQEVLFLAHEYDNYNLGHDLCAETPTMVQHRRVASQET